MALVEVPLRRRDGSVRAVALVDAADAERVLAYNWHLSSKGYATRNVAGGGTEFLHRLILGLGRGDRRQGDHRNHDKLDCRRANLRIATHAENLQNRRYGYGSSSYRGVSWHKQSGRWRSRVKLNGHTYELGFFVNEQHAARVAADFRAISMPFSSEAAEAP